MQTDTRPTLTRMPGIRIPSNFICATARRRQPADAAAMRWLAGFAIITGLDIEDFTEVLGMDPIDLREALTHPRADKELVKQLTTGVRNLRHAFEVRLRAGSLAECRAAEFSGSLADVLSPDLFRPGCAFGKGWQPIVATRMARDVARGIALALAGDISSVIGETQIGKSTPAAHHFLLNLDKLIWLECPPGASERDFLNALAKACGVASRGANMVNGHVKERIIECFERGGWQGIIVEEAHRCWLSRSKAPERIEFLRHLHDRYGAGVMFLATPQFSAFYEAACSGDVRWAPGQLDGRSQPIVIPENYAARERDIRAVAEWHGPDFEDALLRELVSFALEAKGACGALVNAIERSRAALGRKGLTRASERLLEVQTVIAKMKLGLKAPPAAPAQPDNVTQMPGKQVAA